MRACTVLSRAQLPAARRRAEELAALGLLDGPLLAVLLDPGSPPSGDRLTDTSGERGEARVEVVAPEQVGVPRTVVTLARVAGDAGAARAAVALAAAPRIAEDGLPVVLVDVASPVPAELTNAVRLAARHLGGAVLAGTAVVLPTVAVARERAAADVPLRPGPSDLAVGTSTDAAHGPTGRPAEDPEVAALPPVVRGLLADHLRAHLGRPAVSRPHDLDAGAPPSGAIGRPPPPPDPWGPDPGALGRWLLEPVTSGPWPVARVLAALHRSRTDLHEAYPDLGRPEHRRGCCTGRPRSAPRTRTCPPTPCPPTPAPRPDRALRSTTAHRQRRCRSSSPATSRAPSGSVRRAGWWPTGPSVPGPA